MGYPWKFGWEPIVGLLNVAVISGAEFSEPFDVVLRVRQELFMAAQMLSRDVRDRAIGRGLKPEFIEKMERRKWDMGTDEEPDEISNRIAVAVTQIEKLASPILKSKYRR